MHDELQWEAALKTVCDSKWNSEYLMVTSKEMRIAAMSSENKMNYFMEKI